MPRSLRGQAGFPCPQGGEGSAPSDSGWMGEPGAASLPGHEHSPLCSQSVLRTAGSRITPAAAYGPAEGQSLEPGKVRTTERSEGQDHSCPFSHCPAMHVAWEDAGARLLLAWRVGKPLLLRSAAFERPVFGDPFKSENKRKQTQSQQTHL